MGSQEQLGKNIRKARKKAGLTQAQVAQKAGIHPNYFAQIERGEVNPSFEVLEGIARALKIKSFRGVCRDMIAVLGRLQKLYGKLPVGVFRGDVVYHFTGICSVSGN